MSFPSQSAEKNIRTYFERKTLTLRVTSVLTNSYSHSLPSLIGLWLPPIHSSPRMPSDSSQGHRPALATSDLLCSLIRWWCFSRIPPSSSLPLCNERLQHPPPAHRSRLASPLLPRVPKPSRQRSTNPAAWTSLSTRPDTARIHQRESLPRTLQYQSLGTSRDRSPRNGNHA